MDFRTDGIPVGLKYAYKTGVDLSGTTVLVAAPNSDQAIVVTDVVFSTSETVAGILAIYDGATTILKLWNESGNSQSLHFGGPLQLTAGNALKVQMDDTDTDYSILVTYYIK